MGMNIKTVSKNFENKTKDERFICNNCGKKEECMYYEYAKFFIEQDPRNDMKCALYVKE